MPGKYIREPVDIIARKSEEIRLISTNYHLNPWLLPGHVN
jgi:hypothetical protein